MKKENKFYGVNNFSGAHIKGIKDSIYLLKPYFKNFEILEEKYFDNEGNEKLLNLANVVDINQRTFDFADEIFKQNHRPVMIAGDHSIAIGSVSATSKHFDDLGLIWIDAHADINTPQTTPSGNIHGMPVAALLNRCHPSLNQIGGNHPKIKPENIVYLGLRSIDQGEVECLRELKIKNYTYHEIKARGLKTILEEIKNTLFVKHLHFSFDLDSMDPTIIKGVSTPVEGGFNLDEVINIFEFFEHNYEIEAYDFVEFNHKQDTDLQTFNSLLTLLNRLK